MMKVKELLNIRINEHNEDIWQSLDMTSHAKMFLTVCCFGTDSCLNGFGIRLNGSDYPFKKKLSSV